MLNAKKLTLMLSQKLKILPPTVLQNDNHILDQEFLYDHRQQLIYLIVQNYIDKRLKHENDKLCDKKYRIGMFYNKLTIFKGEWYSKRYYYGDIGLKELTDIVILE